MEKRTLGTSSLETTVIGLGCMSIGTDKKEATSILQAAYDAGIRYFDTADLYDQGVNEEIVGAFLRTVQDDVVLATKVGNRFTSGTDGWTWDPRKAYIKEQVKTSLQRLQVEKIDLYQLHGGTMEDPLEETIEAFEELKTEGYISAYGISSIRPAVIDYFAKHSSIQTVMMQHSLLDRRPEEQAYPLLTEHGISVVTRGPVAKGILTERGLQTKYEQVKQRGYNGLDPDTVLKAIHQIKDWAHAHDYSLEALALQYNLAHSPVASVVVGASSVAQITELVQALETNPLTPTALEELATLLPAQVYEAHRIER